MERRADPWPECLVERQRFAYMRCSPPANSFTSDCRSVTCRPTALYRSRFPCHGEERRAQRADGALTMTHIGGEIIITAPVDEVFDMVADDRNEPDTILESSVSKR
jgi:hypothetical protein